MSVLTDILAGLWIVLTGAAAARIAFTPRKKQIINLHIKVRDTGFDPSRWS